MHSFSVLFSFKFHEGSTMVVLKMFKHCVNMHFVSIVYRSVAQPRSWGPRAAPKHSFRGSHSSLSTNP